MANQVNQGGSSIPALLCFATLAGLAAYRANPSLKPVAVAAIGGLRRRGCAVALRGLLYSFNGALRQRLGGRESGEQSPELPAAHPIHGAGDPGQHGAGLGRQPDLRVGGHHDSGSAVGAELMGLERQVGEYAAAGCGWHGLTMFWMAAGSLLRAVVR